MVNLRAFHPGVVRGGVGDSPDREVKAEEIGCKKVLFLFKEGMGFLDVEKGGSVDSGEMTRF